MKLTYNRTDVEKALRTVGLKRGDLVFSHSNLAYFGFPEGGFSYDNLRATILEPILECIGQEGTFVVPTFTYSFPKGEVFDPAKTESLCGVFTEIVRQDAAACRCEDPIFSVAALGSRAREMVEGVSIECFGKDSFWDRFYKADGVVLNLNLGVPATFFHYVERSLNVPYRYNKLFLGTVRKDGRLLRREAIYFCRDLTNDLLEADWMGIQELACLRGLARSADIGRGYITLTHAREIYNLIAETLKTRPFFLTKSRNAKVAPTIIRPRRHFDIDVPKDTRSGESVSLLKNLPLDVVSDGYDAALQAISAQIPMKIHEYPTGAQYGKWIVPEKWTCYKGCLETLNGEKIFSYGDNPAYIASYSRPFEGQVSRKQLLEHLWVDPQIPDAIAAKFLYYDMSWGLCCSQDEKNALIDESYKVAIKTDFSYGTLKIAEFCIPGVKDDTILICAHLSSRAQANDGIAGVTTAIDIFKQLQHKGGLMYSYLLLIVPWDFSIIAYLHDNCAKKIKEIAFWETFQSGVPPVLNLPGTECKVDFSQINVPIFSLSQDNQINTSSEIKELIFRMIDRWESV